MTRTSIISFIALAAGVGGALAAGVGLEDRDAYASPAPVIDEADAKSHAAALFTRADINQDNRLDADEFSALSIVTAELSLLNGFVALSGGEGVKTIALPHAAPDGLSVSERTRLGAIARSEFYAASGDDAVMSADEFITYKAGQFAKADRNRNGRLAKAELRAFAADEANLTGSGV